MKSFVCSLCHNGILGGGLYLDSQSLTYKTNKLQYCYNRNRICCAFSCRAFSCNGNDINDI